MSPRPQWISRGRRGPETFTADSMLQRSAPCVGESGCPRVVRTSSAISRVAHCRETRMGIMPRPSAWGRSAFPITVPNARVGSKAFMA